MKKHLFLLSALVSLSVKSFSQSVGIGTTTPDPSAQVEITSTNKGMLVPRIALSAANVASPVTAPADALLIYNTANAGTGSNSVAPGFYFWKTSVQRWTAMGELADNTAGFGHFSDCSVQNVSHYNPVFPTDLEDGDQFGYASSISGNYAILGASGANGTNVNQGAAYIYWFNGSTWEQQQKLQAPDAGMSDQFGSSVFISGNYAVVGSPYSDNGAANSNQGAAYIFFNNGGNWILQQKLIASDRTASDSFGISVCLAGNRVIVSAPGAKILNNADQGSAYIFTFNGTQWTGQQKIAANDGANGSGFGHTVAIDGDYALVGSPTANGKGAAYMFRYNGSSWLQLQKLQPPDIIADDFFGGAVAMSGTYAVVSAPEIMDYSNRRYGAVYVYLNTATAPNYWILKDRLLSQDGASTTEFGKALSISGEYIAVASPAHINTVNVIIKPKAYIFKNISGHFLRYEGVEDPGGGGSVIEGSNGISIGISNGRFVFGRGETSNANIGSAFFGKID